MIDWYLEQIESEIDSEATLNNKKRQVAAVLERLVKKDGVLIEMNEKPTDEDSILIVHPNYVI